METWIGIEYLKKYINERLNILEKALNDSQTIEDAKMVNGGIAELSQLLDHLRTYQFRKK